MPSPPPPPLQPPPTSSAIPLRLSAAAAATVTSAAVTSDSPRRPNRTRTCRPPPPAAAPSSADPQHPIGRRRRHSRPNCKIGIDVFYHRFGYGIPGHTTRARRRHKRAEVGFELTIKRLPALCLDHSATTSLEIPMPRLHSKPPPLPPRSDSAGHWHPRWSWQRLLKRVPRRREGVERGCGCAVCVLGWVGGVGSTCQRQYAAGRAGRRRRSRAREDNRPGCSHRDEAAVTPRTLTDA